MEIIRFSEYDRRAENNFELRRSRNILLHFEFHLHRALVQMQAGRKGRE